MELFETANTRGEDGSKNIAMLTYANNGGFVTNIDIIKYRQIKKSKHLS